MWIIHAVIFYTVETWRIRREQRISLWHYARTFLQGLWTFLRLEWAYQKRQLGYAPVIVPKGLNGFRQIGRKRMVRIGNKKKKTKKKK